MALGLWVWSNVRDLRDTHISPCDDAPRLAAFKELRNDALGAVALDASLRDAPAACTEYRGVRRASAAGSGYADVQTMAIAAAQVQAG